MAGFERTDAAYAVGEREVVSTIEEAREQARAAAEIVEHRLAGRWLGGSLVREADKDVPALRTSLHALRTLLDATEPPAIQYADSALVAEVAAKIAGENSELMERLADKPAEDERERVQQSNDVAMTVLEVAGVERGGFVPLHTRYGIADALWAAGYRKGPRPITDEMVKEARWAWHAADATTGPGTRMRAALEAAEGARR